MIDPTQPAPEKKNKKSGQALNLICDAIERVESQLGQAPEGPEPDVSPPSTPRHPVSLVDKTPQERQLLPTIERVDSQPSPKLAKPSPFKLTVSNPHVDVGNSRRALLTSPPDSAAVRQ